MKRRKPTPSQQWERLTRQRDAAIAKLVRVEIKLARLRKAMARKTNKQAKVQAKWDQSPLPDDSLIDIQLGT